MGINWSNQVRLLRYWGTAQDHQKKKVQRWLRLTIFGGLFPFWGAWLLIRFLGGESSAIEYLTGGDLALFCGGLLIAALGTIPEVPASPEHDYPEGASFDALIMFAVVTLIMAARAFTGPPGRSDAGRTWVGAVSVVLFVLTIYLGTMVEVVNQMNLTSDDLTTKKNADEARHKSAATASLNATTPSVPDSAVSASAAGAATDAVAAAEVAENADSEALGDELAAQLPVEIRQNEQGEEAAHGR